MIRGEGKRVSLLAKWLLLGAGALTAFYLSGFVFVLIGNPIRQFTDVLDLLRTVAMTTWIVWAIILRADKIREQQRRARLNELARDIGVEGRPVGQSV